MLQNATAIGVLRVRSVARDRAGLRLAVDRQLQGLELTPAGLPPSALLVVRHLADPLPGRLGTDPRCLRPPRAWSAAVQDRLDQLLSAAERPTNGRVSPTAEAVLFADTAELTACLVLDLVRGVAGGHWWWHYARVLVPELPIPAGGAVAGVDPARVLVAVAREMPAILACLGSWRTVWEFVAALDRRQTRRLLDALATTHGLDARVIGHDLTTDEAPVSGPSAASSMARMTFPHAVPELTEGPASRQGARSVAQPSAPWQPWLPAAIGGTPLHPDQRCLVGLALTLYRAPAMARQGLFVRQADAWWRLQAQSGQLVAGRNAVPTLVPGASPEEPGARRDAGHTLVPGASPEETPFADPAANLGRLTALANSGPAIGSASAAADRARRAVLDGTAEPPGAASPHAWRGPAGAPLADLRGTPEGLASVASQEAGRAEFSGPVAEGAYLSPPGTEPEAAPAPTPRGMEEGWDQPAMEPSLLVFSGERFPTRLGGVLYLVHALEDLEIPTAFEDDWQLASRIGPWGALHLVARALLGEDFGDYADDPLWSVLIALTPGSGAFTLEVASPAEDPPDAVREYPPTIDARGPAAWPSSLPAYRAPTRWRTVLAVTEPCFRWAEAAGRIWLWSESGFVIATMARDQRHPLDQAQAEVAAWAGASAWQLRPGRVGDAPLATCPSNIPSADGGYWAAAATPAIVRRLLLALDAKHQDPASLRRLLSVSGTLYLSATHVDLVADLDQIWLPARRVGLDRDPGWLAEYGRVVLFHFR